MAQQDIGCRATGLEITWLSFEYGEYQELEASPFELGVKDAGLVLLVGARRSIRDAATAGCGSRPRYAWHDTSCHDRFSRQERLGTTGRRWRRCHAAFNHLIREPDLGEPAGEGSDEAESRVGQGKLRSAMIGVRTPQPESFKS